MKVVTAWSLSLWSYSCKIDEVDNTKKAKGRLES